MTDFTGSTRITWQENLEDGASTSDRAFTAGDVEGQLELLERLLRSDNTTLIIVRRALMPR